MADTNTPTTSSANSRAPRFSLRAKYARELSYLARTPNSANNPVTYYRAWRDHNMGKARLCAKYAGRQTWVDLAREQHGKMMAAMRARRAHVAKFGVMAEGCMVRRQAGAL